MMACPMSGGLGSLFLRDRHIVRTIYIKTMDLEIFQPDDAEMVPRSILRVLVPRAIPR